MEKETLRFSGRSTMRAWTPGALQKWLDCGLNIRQAQDVARGCGALQHENTVKNQIVDSGLSLVGAFLLNLGPVGLTYHAIGTGVATLLPGDTALVAEVNRKVWTLSSQAGNTVSFSVFYAAAECTYDLKEAGVFGGAASSTPGSGTMFSHYVQLKDNHLGALDLTFDYDITEGAE
jgi:hypothetical protein